MKNECFVWLTAPLYYSATVRSAHLSVALFDFFPLVPLDSVLAKNNSHAGTRWAALYFFFITVYGKTSHKAKFCLQWPFFFLFFFQKSNYNDWYWWPHISQYFVRVPVPSIVKQPRLAKIVPPCYDSFSPEVGPSSHRAGCRLDCEIGWKAYFNERILRVCFRRICLVANCHSFPLGKRF